MSATAAAPAAARVRRLTDAQLAGQRVIYSYAGLEPPAALMRAIRAGEAGGVIFFGPNIAGRSQLRATIERMQRAALASPVHERLLTMTDQEGGEVRRLPGAPELSQRQVGESPDPVAAARRAGTGAGRNLASVGMNVDLAPVLDVYRAAGDFDDRFGRSYSRDPRIAGRLGAAFVVALQRTGVAAAVKHFPGLGASAASQDTDLRPVTLPLARARLRSLDEAPYPPAIAAGAKLAMTSWAVYPALDPRRPAGLSPSVIGRELRDRLRFDGVTITDAIDAGALRAFGGIGARAVLAARAGADLILSGPTARAGAPQGVEAARALTRALADGRLDRAASVAAVTRILALRRRP